MSAVTINTEPAEPPTPIILLQAREKNLSRMLVAYAAVGLIIYAAAGNISWRVEPYLDQ